MLQLIIEPAGRRPRALVNVDETAFVGTCVASLVERLEYPTVNTGGRPVTYQLRVAESGKTLPNTLRFGQIRIASGTRLVLEMEGANDATIPAAAHGGSWARPELAIGKRRWSRRSLLAAGVCIAVFGLGSGISTAFAQRSLFKHASDGARPVPSGTPPDSPKTLRGATARLTFSAHQQTVRTVSWSSTGTMLASGADDAQLLVWSPDGTLQQRIPHPAPVQSLAWSPESQRLVSGSANQVTFLSALNGEILARSARHTAAITSVQWTANNQMQVVSGAEDKRAVVWETTQYQPQAVFTGHDAPILAVSWGSDGQTVASASQGGVVRIWNAETTREVHGFYQDAPSPMRACAFTSTGSMLAVGGNDGVIRIWNGFICQQQTMGNGGLMCRDVPARLHISDKAIRSVAWSPDGRYLASGSDDGSFSIWTLAQQHPLFSITVQPGVAVHSIAWATDGNQLATASGNSVILWLLT
ncbi:hypothetical protein KDA_76240 [Dictyobacter alpinus]|uniref:Uncharacterized protein n=1 Tax=Dictyobacter alpinus TaxID=2014873 RepID=A0A402BLF9_9CHLR|nr:WD40 repeat domain-containing protein [Dictyobacter alpinus]GCE32140.1 hypothetical protein KDA_76240 [Dictyobacter alpinus]